jgi:hypothetical protein
VFALGKKGKSVVLLAGIIVAWPVCHAVLFKSTGNPTYNTTAPTGSLTNSGWQYEGFWNGYLATPIAPTFFLAAKHIGGSINSLFVFNGLNYHTVAVSSNSNNDLLIWQVAETFPQYAPLYTNTNEVGKHCVVFGTGKQRSNAVVVAGVTNGWQWGIDDRVERWGENDVSTNQDLGAGVGQTLECTFNRAGGSNECQLTEFDSSGAMFIQDGTTWKLAGIHYGISTYLISTNGVNGSGFNAAMLDYGGVYLGGDGNWSLVTNQVSDIPSSFASSRVSANIAWINSVINFLPGNDLQIKAVTTVGTNVLINFTTSLNKTNYVIERRDSLTDGSWTRLTNNIVGTGGIMIYTNDGAATVSNRFYRLGLVP